MQCTDSPWTTQRFARPFGRGFANSPLKGWARDATTPRVMAQTKTAITPTREENYPEWYQQVIAAADLAEASGCAAAW